MNAPGIRQTIQETEAGRIRAGKAVRSMAAGSGPRSSYGGTGKSSDVKYMQCLPKRAILILLLLLCVAGPASASLHLKTISLNPIAANLAPGIPVNMNVQIAVIPAGETTFVTGHSVQMATDLKEPRWKIVVLVDGVDGAVIPVEGRVAFVNGYLLSYPTQKDVTVSVSLSGMAPPGTDTGGLFLLQATELDNAGQPVPGSIVEVPLRYLSTRTTATIPESPGMTEVPRSTGTQGSPGFYYFVALAAIPAAAYLAKQFRPV